MNASAFLRPLRALREKPDVFLRVSVPLRLSVVDVMGLVYPPICRSSSRTAVSN